MKKINVLGGKVTLSGHVVPAENALFSEKMNFRKIMNAKHRHATKIEHLKKTIEHCISVVAICEIGGQENAKASYEARLKQLNEELAELLKQNGEEK